MGDYYLKRVYIKREVNFLSADSKKVIRNIIWKSNKDAIKESPDGIRCDLNQLSDETVAQIYTYMNNTADMK